MANEINHKVTLREITKDTFWSIIKLEVGENQIGYVAPNVTSIAEAYFSEYAWFRAIYADQTPVGFVMVYIDSEKPEYYLWRLMIDSEFQGKGFGRAALELVIDYIRTLPGAKEFFTSYVPGEGDPSPFYKKMGFEPFGEEFLEAEIMHINMKLKNPPI